MDRCGCGAGGLMYGAGSAKLLAGPSATARLKHQLGGRTLRRSIRREAPGPGGTSWGWAASGLSAPYNRGQRATPHRVVSPWGRHPPLTPRSSNVAATGSPRRAAAASIASAWASRPRPLWDCSAVDTRRYPARDHRPPAAAALRRPPPGASAGHRSARPVASAPVG